MNARSLGVVRAQTSALVDDFLIDVGGDTARSAERAGTVLAGVRHVLLTHDDPDHPDHTAAAFLLSRCAVAGDEPLDVVGPATVVTRARQWLPPQANVTFHPVTGGDVIDLAGGTVRVLDAQYRGDAVLYDISAPSGRVLYANGTGPLPQTTVDAVTGAAYDVVLLEQTFGDLTGHGTDHLDLPSFAEQVRRLRAVGALVQGTDLVAVHLSHHNPPLPELQRRLAAYGARVVPDGTVLGTGTADASADSPRQTGSSDQPAGGSLRTLVIGGARSGKSGEAERLLAAEQDVTYIATSYPRSTDPEWVERVWVHQQQRPGHWDTVETLQLAELLRDAGGPLLIDCLTLWLTRVMDRHGAWDDDAWRQGAAEAVRAEVAELVQAWRATGRRVVAVTNEIGQGLVPAEASLRRFRDEMGRLNSAIAAESEDVRYCVAGRVLTL